MICCSRKLPLKKTIRCAVRIEQTSITIMHVLRSWKHFRSRGHGCETPTNLLFQKVQDSEFQICYFHHHHKLTARWPWQHKTSTKRYVSFIVGRTQTVHCGGSVSRRAQLRSGIAQGSVLGPILYILYTADVQKLVESFGFRVHLYADDTQFQDSCRSTDAAVLAARAMRVIEAVRDWMSSNWLRLNADKTQFIWLGTSHFLDVLQINSIPANEVVNNLGVYFDPELLMERQVNKLCQVCYFHLRRLRTVRRSLTKESLLTLVHAFITSRVDHCNGVLCRSNGYLLDRLQSVLN